MNPTGALAYVVDDDVSAREGVARLIRSAGVMTKTFASGEEFLASGPPKMPSCLVLDLNLPGLSGLDLQQELAKSGVQVPIIFLSGHGDIPTTVRALKAGATNFLTKPFEDEDLLNAVQQCLTSDLEDQVQFDEGVGNMVGESAGFRGVANAIQIVAPTDAAVLIQGETGTGKELVARAIHDRSSRSNRPFIKVNCAAIPATLLESELFGHEKGAFTGAFAQKLGRFELAHGGTLFLDEIGEIPLELQPKLLRALQEQEFERLGGNRTIQVDVRVIAATNRNLKAMVEENKFRADLYYRLDVFPLTVPPLRERRQDIPLLIRYFVQKHAGRMGRRIERIPTESVQALTSYPWPGNIRELQNVIERSIIMSNGPELRVAMPELNDNPAPVALRAQRPSGSDPNERALILQALKEANGQVGGADGAAARLGFKRTTLQSRMRKYNIARHFQ
ncbi:MAG: sigma-54-dependent Fis family transcriptional regulator [Bryobacterales bacterium]|nr:sigma-54-dependent Fis family transcriptional regulator [Bryobacterales bacterium]